METKNALNCMKGAFSQAVLEPSVTVNIRYSLIKGDRMTEIVPHKF